MKQLPPIVLIGIRPMYTVWQLWQIYNLLIVIFILMWGLWVGNSIHLLSNRLSCTQGRGGAGVHHSQLRARDGVHLGFVACQSQGSFVTYQHY